MYVEITFIYFSSSANAKKWEIELTTLKNSNARLTSALQESTANVEQWKRQLHSYKEENTRLKVGLIELEAGRGELESNTKRKTLSPKSTQFSFSKLKVQMVTKLLSKIFAPLHAILLRNCMHTPFLVSVGFRLLLKFSARYVLRYFLMHR